MVRGEAAAAIILVAAMLKIFGLSVLAVTAGYLVGLFGGMFLINRFSSNKHDKSVEAAMTSAFVVGPLVAVLALAGTLVYLLQK